MANNNKNSLVDQAHVLKNSYDSVEEGIRVIPTATAGFSIELDSADGDSVLIVGTDDGTPSGNQNNVKVDNNGNVSIRADSIAAESGTLNDFSSGDAIAATPSSGIKSYQIYAEALTATTGNIDFRIDVSPADSGSTFFETTTTLSLPASSLGDVVISSLLTNIVARRVKVAIIANNLGASEEAKVYLVGASL